MKASLLALLVTFIWSTSWVLIKVGLREMPALIFAGLRYMLAFLCLLPFALRPANQAALRSLTRADWLGLAGLGVLYYAVAQGTQFVGLSYLPSVAVSLMLNFTGALVAGLGVVFLAERPSALQWAGVAINLLGILIYFMPLPSGFKPGWQVGVGVMLAGVLANAAGALLGRGINRTGKLSPLVVTVTSMGIGSTLLLGAGLASGGLAAIATLTPRAWGIILLLAVVNTALAFTLWNYSLQTLSAMESSIINGTMLIQIAVLAWLFLGESLSAKMIAGMALAALGALLVQVRINPRNGI
jgi:drug/metabolite transporter (DMT)-like permease